VGNIANRVGRKLTFDVAIALLQREYEPAFAMPKSI